MVIGLLNEKKCTPENLFPCDESYFCQNRAQVSIVCEANWNEQLDAAKGNCRFDSLVNNNEDRNASNVSSEKLATQLFEKQKNKKLAVISNRKIFPSS
jgi:hypothetical protein